jgi:hypothetical protein
LIGFLFLVLGLSLSFADEKCPAMDTREAVDLSAPTNSRFLDKMKVLGIKTIIRYYDYPRKPAHPDPNELYETWPGKTLHKPERDRIVNKGLSMAVVFQHNNSSLGTFTPSRGRRDAEQALKLARENLQPRGSAIYFGVDGGWQLPEQIEKVRSYFREAKIRIQNAGYRIGAYGSGLVCSTLLTEELAELCWLSNAMAWPGSTDFLQTERWSLRQYPAVDCGGRNVDFNDVPADRTNFGQFGR